jgi:hypothetical protein
VGDYCPLFTFDEILIFNSLLLIGLIMRLVLEPFFWVSFLVVGALTIKFSWSDEVFLFENVIAADE